MRSAVTDSPRADWTSAVPSWLAIWRWKKQGDLVVLCSTSSCAMPQALESTPRCILPRRPGFRPCRNQVDHHLDGFCQYALLGLGLGLCLPSLKTAVLQGNCDLFSCCSFNCSASCCDIVRIGVWVSRMPSLIAPSASSTPRSQPQRAAPLEVENGRAQHRLWIRWAKLRRVMQIAFFVRRRDQTDRRQHQ